MISIIVPVYNADRYIDSLATQLQQQTDEEFEVLFIDDGSTDDSGKHLERLRKTDSRFQVYRHTQNSGQGTTRNTGLSHARGEFVMYIDADDSFEPNYLQRMRASINEDQSDVAICNSIWEYGDRREPHNTFVARPRTRHLCLRGKDALLRYFNVYLSDLWIPVEPWGKIVRRSFLETHVLRYKTAIYEDVVMTFSELALASRVTLIGDYLYRYNRSNVGAATVKRQGRYIREIYRAPQGILDTIQMHQLKDLTEYAHLFFFRFLNGTYSFFARGLRFREEMSYTLRQYATLLPDPQIGDRGPYVLQNLKGLYWEMKDHEMLDLYSDFAARYHTLIDRIVMEQIPLYGCGVRRDVTQALNVLRSAVQSAARRVYGRIRPRR